jgi:pimeloyl-ACP methyl ester carboxylesterase
MDDPPITTTLLDSPALKITYTPGNTDTAVVSLSGIALQIGAVPKEEFVKTLHGTNHHQYFVIDKNRTWYNATEAQLLTSLVPILRSYRKVVTLGNSMGGFGAIYFASRLPNCRTAIAFVPQFSACPEVLPKETRWRGYRSQITAWPIRHAMQGARDDIQLSIFFGARERLDKLHLRAFQRYATPATCIYSFPDADHDLALYLRSCQLLREILNAIIVEDAQPADIAALTATRGVRYSIWTPQDTILSQVNRFFRRLAAHSRRTAH